MQTINETPSKLRVAGSSPAAPTKTRLSSTPSVVRNNRTTDLDPQSVSNSFQLDSTRRPVAIDLYCGLGGWTEALLAEGWDVYGFDVQRHDYGTGGYPGNLILQDVCTIHGAQFAHADLIVASPPCQEFSYRAMPWKRAKALPPPYLGINLFWQCWRIQHEACEAAGRYIPMVVENVKGAQKWIGRAVWHYGSFYLWGDVPALMPRTWGGVMKRGVAHRANGETNFHGSAARAKGEHGGVKLPGNDTFKRNGKPCNKLTDPRYGSNADGHKNARNWWSDGVGSLSATTSSKSPARKAASAHIAKIPQPLAQHIARVYFPDSFARTGTAEASRSAEKSALTEGAAV